jgi:DNA-binding transcriptional MerR regulator
MRIGELAARSGVTVRTVRYYVEEGLLPEPPLRGKYGDFDESYVQRIQLIRRLKEERLSITDIRQRLVQMGLMPTPPPTAGPAPGSWGQGEVPPPLGGAMGEGLFRSRFAEEAGLTPEQAAQLERLGLFESREGLLPPDQLPLGRAAAQLLSWGMTIDDMGTIAQQLQQEARMHQRLLQHLPPDNALTRALQWQEQVTAVSTIREMLLQRWGRFNAEDSDD